ncbi:unnamed protein product, partial [Ectocarpus fasciculatus]
RTVGGLPGVSVSNSTSVEYSALQADQFCGNGTRLIYYMEVGQILSRSILRKDTHTARGNLIVAAEEVHEVHVENAARAMGSVIVLGFAAPTFTYGSDLILPAEINGQLRTVLVANERRGKQKDAALDTDAENQMKRVYTHLALVADLHRGYTSIYVPEVLAALAYSNGPEGVDFINIREWHRENLFSSPSIWEIPLVKPRFGCSFDASLGLRGYRVGDSIANELEAFKMGATCELGYRTVETSKLEVNHHWEFGPDAANKPMPNLEVYNISVMYRTFSGDAMLFNLSLASLIDRFPSAMEVVVVVVESDKALFESIVEPFRAIGPLPIHVVAEPDLMDGHVQQKYSKMRADLYTKGDYVLHMDSDVIVFEDVTYAHIFHLHKPVLPYRRYRTDAGFEAGLLYTLCWQSGTSFTMGEDVLHEYSIFNTHVYPRSMYSAARRFLTEHHNTSMVDFMSTRRGQCEHPNEMRQYSDEDNRRMFSDFNFFGAYLWYHMHDAVHWLPADPYDARLDDWRPNLLNYAWVCQANGRHVPSDATGYNQYVADHRMVTTLAQCEIVRRYWDVAWEQDPAIRTGIDTDSRQWRGGL